MPACSCVRGAQITRAKLKQILLFTRQIGIPTDAGGDRLRIRDVYEPN